MYASQGFVNGGGWWGLLWRSHGVMVAPFGWGRPWVVVVFGLAKFVPRGFILERNEFRFKLR